MRVRHVRLICRSEENADMMNVSVLRVAKGADWITFIRDYDGNHFEIKENRV